MVLGRIRSYFRLRPRGQTEAAAEVDEEIRLHLQLRARQLMASGLDHAAAWEEAERRFGPPDCRHALHRQAHLRERRLGIAEWLDGWRQDFRFAGRALAREPYLAFAVVLILGVTIGANASIFAVVDKLSLRGAGHIEAPDQVRRAYVSQPTFDGRVTTSATVSYATGAVLGELGDVFSGVAVYRYGQMRVGRGQSGGSTWAGWATPDLFPLLGVKPAAGRYFVSEEDRPGAAARVAVLEYGYSQSRFGGPTEALGQAIELDGVDYEIIGVAPRGFTGPELKPARVWVPFGTGPEPSPDWATTWSARWAHVIVRLREDATWTQAASQSTAQLRREAANRQGASGITVRFLPATYTDAGGESSEAVVSKWLMAVAGILLVVGCVNVANMLLARGMRRRGELAVRVALGASKHRLARLFLTDSVLLAVVGGVAGLSLASAFGLYLQHLLMPEMLWGPVLSNRVILFTTALALATALALSTGLIGRLRADELHEMLRSQGPQAGQGRTSLMPALTVVQAAFALVLLVGAGHFVRSVYAVHRMDLGIDSERVLIAWVDFQNPAEVNESEREAYVTRLQAFNHDAVERLRARPDVAAAAIASSAPMSGGTMGVPTRIPGRDSLPLLPGGGPYVTYVGDGYFETVGTRVVRGRGIQQGDVAAAERVLVVNETMAETLWPENDAIGQCIHVGATTDLQCYRIVGIAEDARRTSLIEEPAMQYYVPLDLGNSGQILVRPVTRASSYLPELRSILHGFEPRLTFAHVELLQNTIAGELRPWRVGVRLFLISGVVALLMAAIGLYSVVAYSASLRRHEIGVRIAFGATMWHIVAMITRHAVGLVLLGIIAGLPLAILVSRRLEGVLFAVEAGDPSTFGLAAAILLFAGCVAAAIPALRASRIGPLHSMRGD